MSLRSDNSYTILVSHRRGKRGGVMGLPGAYEETFSRKYHYGIPGNFLDLAIGRRGRYEDRRIFLARIGEEILLHRRHDRAAEILVFDAEGNEVDPEYFVKVYGEVSRKYRHWRNAISLENPRRNPMRRNAGRHFRRGKKVRDHGEFYMGAYEGDPTLFSMSKDELVDMGTAAAIKELRRRGRDRDGVKLAWKR